MGPFWKNPTVHDAAIMFGCVVAVFAVVAASWFVFKLVMGVS